MESIQFHCSCVDAMSTMWCNRCRQDVPGVVPAENGKYSCPRCSNALCGGEAIISVTELPHAETQAECDQDSEDPSLKPSPTTTYDSWALGEDLDHADRVLQIGDHIQHSQQSNCEHGFTRFDPMHHGLNDLVGPTRRRKSSAKSGDTDDGVLRLFVSFLTWTALSLGLMAFVCGGILLGYSIFSGREDIWNVGVPIALSGQIGILIGLGLQLDRLWHDNRQTFNKLDNVDDRLKDLQNTTSLIDTNNRTPGGAFYAHMAGGAGPQMLLNDLKSQLDLLALKISREN